MTLYELNEKNPNDFLFILYQNKILKEFLCDCPPQFTSSVL